MSDVIQVWEQPVPTSSLEAPAILVPVIVAAGFPPERPTRWTRPLRHRQRSCQNCSQGCVRSNRQRACGTTRSGQRKAHFSESIDARIIADKLVGACGLEQVVEHEATLYSARLAQRRHARPDPGSHAMLAREEAERDRGRSTLLDFVRQLP